MKDTAQHTVRVSSGPSPRHSMPSASDLITLHVGDAVDVMASLPAKSIHMVLTDPPYFIDGLDSSWKKGSQDAPRATGSVGGLPVGMKFDRSQSYRLQSFMSRVAHEWMRLLLPGGFALVFSQPRLVHRIAVAMEDTGFEIRDQICWRFTQRAQFKAFRLNHFVERMDISTEEKSRIIKSLGNRRTPQLRPQFEAIVVAQKPREGTFLKNWLIHKTGLIDPEVKVEGKSPSNIITCEKPKLSERALTNGHLTPKPVALLETLIRLFTVRGQVVLDPFIGSGSTAVAAKSTGRKCIGIDVNPEYIEVAKRRVGS